MTTQKGAAMTESAHGDAPTVRPDDIVWIAKDVWSSFLGIDLEPVAPTVPAQRAADEERLTGVIEVSGAWEGSVEVGCPPATARALAAAMLGSAPEAIGANDVTDALGELANMVGGNVKSLLPAPSRLSLPVVRAGERPGDGATLASAVELVAPATGDPVSITVWLRVT
jgi:chemotaxis protein CheX